MTPRPDSPFPFLLVAAAFATIAPGQRTLIVPTQHATIQAAIDAAQSGDTVRVLAGTYVENLDLRGKRLAVTSVEGAKRTIVDGSGQRDAVVTAASGEPAGTTLCGFTLTRGAGKPFASSYGFDYYGGGVFAGGRAQLRVEACWIVDNALATGTFAGGVYSGGEGTYVEVVGSLIAHNRAWASGGATLVDHAGRMRIDRCTVIGNSSDNFFGWQGGISMANYGQVDVVSTIAWGNAGDQIGAFGPPYNRGTRATVTYSDVQRGFVGEGNLDSDPRFQSAATRDYRLRLDSPCIDAGDPTAPRDPNGSRADIGAFPTGGPRASFAIFGIGCAGTAGTLTLDARAGSLPRLGEVLTLDVTALPATAPFAVIELGLFRERYAGVALPIELAPWGMPTCRLYQSRDLAFGVLNAGNRAVWSVLVPVDARLAGSELHLQAWVVDPTANARGVVASNGATATVGH